LALEGPFYFGANTNPRSSCPTASRTTGTRPTRSWSALAWSGQRPPGRPRDDRVPEKFGLRDQESSIAGMRRCLRPADAIIRIGTFIIKEDSLAQMYTARDLVGGDCCTNRW